MAKETRRLSRLQKLGASIGAIFLFCCGCIFLITLLPSPEKEESVAKTAGEVVEAEVTTAQQLETLEENATSESTELEIDKDGSESTRTSEPTAVSTLAPTIRPTSSNTPIPATQPQSEASIGSLTLESGEEINGETASVTRIIDGDTIEVDINGATYRVRYIGMDTPERGDTFFSEATEANRLLVENQTVILVKDVSETDRYGRLLRYVYLQDGTFVNAELVRQGFALVATFPPDVAHQAEFVALQEEARNAGNGLWAGVVVAASTNTPAPLPTNTIASQPTNTVESEPTVTPLPQPTNTQAAPPTDTPVPQPAPASVVISNIFYDGRVTRVESDEYAQITNQGGSAVNLAGWRLNAGDPGQNFNFPNFDLQPGQSCRVYTNEIHPETCGFSFGSGQAIWNNGGDCGYLYDASGAEVSRRCY